MAPDSDPEILADGGAGTPRPRIAVFAGPNATILNSPPLVTGRGRSGPHGVGATAREPVLRPQRLAAPVTVFVEALSAHPLEADSGDLYGPPDAWIDEAGALHETEVPASTAVYRVALQPSDGLYVLPYVATQADGSPWDDTGTTPEAPREQNRQTFYPDASRLYEEIDRFGVGYDGRADLLSTVATFDHFRTAPSGGWTKGTTQVGPEREGEDYFAYFPYHLATEPSATDLAAITNQVQRVLASGRYAGGQWLEGSPTVEETLYWLSLLIDTPLPIVGHAAQRPHLAIGADGDRNIVDGVAFIASRAWSDDQGRNRLGAVLVVDEMVLSAREVAKTDARPGNYVTVGGNGGVVASLGGDGPIHLTFVPVRRHTYCSEVRLTALPATVAGVRSVVGVIGPVVEPVAVVTASGELRAAAIPQVTIHTYARYRPAAPDVVSEEPALDAEIAHNLAHFQLSGFVGEGNSPYVTMHPSTDAALRRAVLSGLPVVKVGRGHPGGDAHRRDPIFIAGNDLTATKARLLLMAAMLKLGAMPPAADPSSPTEIEVERVLAHVARYQAIFDTH